MNAVASPTTLSVLFEELGKRRTKIDSLRRQIELLDSLTLDSKMEAAWAADDAGEHRGQIYYQEKLCERLIGEFIIANSYERGNQGALIVAMSSLSSYELTELLRFAEILADKTKNNGRELQKFLRNVLSIDLDRLFLIQKEMEVHLAKLEFLKKYPDLTRLINGEIETVEVVEAALKSVWIKLECFIAQSLKTIFPAYSQKSDLILETADLSDEQLLELTALAKKMKEMKTE